MNPWHDSAAYAAQAQKVESAGEALLLSLLWWRRDGWTVRTQEPVEQYRVDLFVPEARVAIEVDSLGGHGSNAAMERDARKRNLVVGRGWAPLTFSARQTIFSPHDTLQAALALIQGRLPGTPRPSGRPKPPPPDLRDFALGGRALLAALVNAPADVPDEVRLSATLRAMANRSEKERAGANLFRIVLECPTLIRDPLLSSTLASVKGPVALAAAELDAALTGDSLNEAVFLARCPAMLQPIALRQLRDWWREPETAHARAWEIAREIEPPAVHVEAIAPPQVPLPVFSPFRRRTT